MAESWSGDHVDSEPSLGDFDAEAQMERELAALARQPLISFAFQHCKSAQNPLGAVLWSQPLPFAEPE